MYTESSHSPVEAVEEEQEWWKRSSTRLSWASSTAPSAALEGGYMPYLLNTGCLRTYLLVHSYPRVVVKWEGVVLRVVVCGVVLVVCLCVTCFSMTPTHLADDSPRTRAALKTLLYSAKSGIVNNIYIYIYVTLTPCSRQTSRRERGRPWKRSSTLQSRVNPWSIYIYI